MEHLCVLAECKAEIHRGDVQIFFQGPVYTLLVCRAGFLRRTLRNDPTCCLPHAVNAHFYTAWKSEGICGVQMEQTRPRCPRVRVLLLYPPGAVLALTQKPQPDPTREGKKNQKKNNNEHTHTHTYAHVEMQKLLN